MASGLLLERRGPRTLRVMNATHRLRSIVPVFALALAALLPGTLRAEPYVGDVRAEQLTVERGGNIVAGVSGHIGVHDTLVLSRDDQNGDRQQVDLYAAPTAGFALEVDYKLSDHFAVGVESLFLWVEHEDDGDRRLVINPHLRGRVAIPATSWLAFEATLALGMSWWEEDQDDTGNRPLDAIAASRLGFGMRFAIGSSIALSELLALNASLGYATALTPADEDDGLDARFGTILFGLGVRLGL